MELRRLRLLSALSRLGTVAAVAEAMSYSPSSVSVQLAELEREAGTPLLRKAGRTLELTAAGRRLAAYAEDALTADEAIRAELALIQDAPTGRVRMSIVQSPALALLPTTLDRLTTTAPDLQIEVQQLETAPALEQLRSREVDLVVGIEYDPLPVPRHRDVDRVDLLREDVLIAAHPDRLASVPPGPVGLTDLRELAWATGHRGTGLNAVVRNVCNRLGGYEPDIRHRSDDGLVLGALVASSRAVALLPMLLTTAIPQVTTRPVREEALQRTIFTATRASAVQASGIRATRQALHDTAAALVEQHHGLHLAPSPSATP